MTQNVMCVHTVEYYSVMKMNGIVACAPTQMNVQDIMLSEVSQLQKYRHYIIPLTYVLLTD